MAVFVITYDLRTPGRDYGSLTTELTNAGAQQATDSCWIYDSGESAEHIGGILRRHVDAGDRLFICPLRSGARWHNPIADEKWLSATLDHS